SLRTFAVLSIAFSMTSSASFALARYISNACSGVNVFAYFAHCPASGILNMSAILAAPLAGFDAALARGFAFFRARLRAGDAVDFDAALFAMISAPGWVRNNGAPSGIHSTPSARRRQYRRARDRACPKTCQRLVRAGQRIGFDVDRQRKRGGDSEKRVAIAASEIGDRADAALAPKQPIRKRRNVAHMDARADHRAAPRRRSQRDGNQGSGRCEDQRRVQRRGRRFVAPAGPVDAKTPREPLSVSVSRPGEGVDGASLCQRDLRDEMRRGPETVNAERSSLARHRIRTISDQPRAQERRRVQIVVAVGQREHEACVGTPDPRVAAIELIAGKASFSAKILPARLAERAMSARRAEPRNADASADGRPSAAGAVSD